MPLLEVFKVCVYRPAKTPWHCIL